jgi:serine protease
LAVKKTAVNAGCLSTYNLRYEVAMDYCRRTNRPGGSGLARSAKTTAFFIIIALAFPGWAAAADDVVVNKTLFGTGETGEYAPGEIVVLFEDFAGAETANAAIEKAGVKLIERSRVNASRVVISVPEGEEDAYADLFAADENVRYAEKNYYYYAQFVPNDTHYDLQWHYNKPNFIHAEEGWDVERGDPGVIVAVVDTGVAYETRAVPAHELDQVRGDRYVQAPDLAGTNFVAGYDFVHGDQHPNDQNGHGTHVAGTIAQTTDNGANVAGLAHYCSIMPVQVLGYDGSGTLDDVADGIDYARRNGAHVVNMSLGGPDYSEILKTACDEAEAAGVVVLAASGNDGSAYVSYPAAFDSVIAVGAVDFNGDLAYYSNYGPDQEIVAPGGDINVDLNGDGYADGVLQMTFTEMYEPGFFDERLARVDGFSNVFLQGTSMACPHASALAALLISNGVKGNVAVRKRLHDTATDLGIWGQDDEFGYGLINAEAALKNEIPEAGCGDCGDFALFDLGLFFTMYGVLFVYRRVKK